MQYSLENRRMNFSRTIELQSGDTMLLLLVNSTQTICELPEQLANGLGRYSGSSSGQYEPSVMFVSPVDSIMSIL